MYHSTEPFITPTISIPAPDWTATIKRGDLIALAAVEGDNPAALHVPCLVLDVLPAAKGKRLLVCPGLPGCGPKDAAYEIGLRRPEDWRAAGLDGPTRFLASARIVIGTASKKLPAATEGTSPIIGEIGGRGLARMNTVRARIQAERDIASYDERRLPAGQTRDPQVPARLHRRL